ncbi:DNA cytosine methyltransferase [Flavobacterium sp.]|uniref:DNA cytosine methyltransferase n=1 Tax=Flavobacterium sp. TaxID=239 RepID=UPI0039E56FC6
MAIPIIDIFAGPGGLAEGFSSLIDEHGEREFEVALSIEKDPVAHQTLKLRSFYRQFPINQAPTDYYRFVRGEIELQELYDNYPIEAQAASQEAWCATLGDPDSDDNNGVSNDEVDQRITIALEGEQNWVLTGGPPCQAYSLVGRSRRQELVLNGETDKRVELYKEYLRIIAVHSPAVFVMENVKGLLSARVESAYIFNNILRDLKDPVAACLSEGAIPDINQPHINYRIYSLTAQPLGFDNENPIFNPRDYIIKAEDYGVPQKRHRVILLGIREDINPPQEILIRNAPVSLESIIGNLPSIRSGITRSFTHSELVFDENGKPKKKRFYQRINDNYLSWQNYIRAFNGDINGYLPPLHQQDLPSSLGDNFTPSNQFDVADENPLANWYRDERLGGILHHVSRKHLLQDIKRYLFASRYAIENGTFPRLADYRQAELDLMPDHENSESGKFTDRFRVQLPDIPATTITSHISKDGHYFIHYDPKQSRSFTVREAARVQTFPDNYYFCGERTNQFHQVGNAVPPYLAYQIAEVVLGIFDIQNAIPENINEEING